MDSQRTAAAIYVRQSLDKNGDHLAVDRQEAECRQLAERRGWTVEAVYSDNDTSASSRKPRPAWTRMLAAAGRGEFDVIIAWQLDRLTRSLRDVLPLLDLARDRKHPVSTATVSGDLDLANDQGRMQAGILASIAMGEVERKATRQKSANVQAAKIRDVRWTVRPFGFGLALANGTGKPLTPAALKAARMTKKPLKIVVLADEADEIRKAARKILAGKSAASICREMNARGITTTTGKPFHPTALRRVLLNPRIAGKRVHNGTTYGAAFSWQPIVSVATYDKLIALFQDPRRRTAQQSGNVRHLGSGLYLCGACGDGTRVFSGADSDGRMIYRCITPAPGGTGSRRSHLSRSLDLVDRTVTEGIILRLGSRDAAHMFQPHVDVDKIRTKITELRGRRDDLAALLGEGKLSREAVDTASVKLTDQITKLQWQIDAATRDSPLHGIIDAPDVAKAWADLSLLRKRALISALCTVTIEPAGRGGSFDPEQIKFSWKA